MRGTCRARLATEDGYRIRRQAEHELLNDATIALGLFAPWLESHSSDSIGIADVSGQLLTSTPPNPDFEARERTRVPRDHDA